MEPTSAPNPPSIAEAVPSIDPPPGPTISSVLEEIQELAAISASADTVQDIQSDNLIPPIVLDIQ